MEIYLGYIFCGIAGGLAAHFGGFGGIVATLIGMIGMIIVLNN